MPIDVGARPFQQTGAFQIAHRKRLFERRETRPVIDEIGVGDQCGPFTQYHWRHAARTAKAFFEVSNA